jgi:hypothetical protein
MLSIVLITPPIAALAVPPCLIATIRVSLKFRALRERPYNERIWLQILKKLREEKNAVREFRRCEERGDMFRCLVVCTKYNKFTPVLAIVYLASNLRLACGVQGSRVWRKSRSLEHSIGRSRLLQHHPNGRII